MTCGTDIEKSVDSVINGRDATNLMANGYLTAAFWTNEEESEFYGKGFYDIDIEELQKVLTMIVNFINKNSQLIETGIEQSDDLSWEHAGHDLWLTRNGHGSGFWDGDWPEKIGETLTEECKKLGESTMYVGDDGKVYFM